MRILTRGDFDGLTSSVLLTEVEMIREIRFAHPKDVQDGLVGADAEDIIVNLPYVPGCGLWFDHHISEDHKLDQIGSFQGRFETAPSSARVIYNYYRNEKFEPYLEMLEETDRVDSAQLTEDDVHSPEGWVLLSYTLDPRTGLGPEFRKYFRWLVEYVKEVSVEKVLQHTEVHKRCQRVLIEKAQFEEVLENHSRLDGTVVITDLRKAKHVPVGNRFLVFTMYPAANVEMRVFHGKDDRIVVAAGHSIFNRTCQVNLGELLGSYGGGGHRGAATVQLPPDVAEEKIAEILAILQANKPE